MTNIVISYLPCQNKLSRSPGWGCSVGMTCCCQIVWLGWSWFVEEPVFAQGCKYTGTRLLLEDLGWSESTAGCLWEATGLQPNSSEVPEPEGQVSAAVTWQVQCPINSGYSSALQTKRMSAYSFKLQCHKTAKKTEF